MATENTAPLFLLRELLEAEAEKTFGVAPFVLAGAIAKAGFRPDDELTLADVKQAVQAFLHAPAK